MNNYRNSYRTLLKTMLCL
nr:unnamed protein product [Callosobruchus chinensis]